MKKIITLAFVALITLTGNAQLRVDSLGRIKIGNYEGTYTNIYNATVGATKTGGGLYIHNMNNASSQYGMNVNWRSSSSYPMAINAQSYSMTGASWVVGIRGEVYGGDSTNPYKSIGVLGCSENISSTTFMTGVFGASTHYAVLPSSGFYAGYFQGDVRATGTIYGTLLSPSSASSPTVSAMAVRDDGNSVTGKLQQVDLLQMERINQDGSLAANQIDEKEDADTMASNGSLLVDEVPTGTKNKSEKPIQTRLSSVSYGLAADQLKEVYPELVYEDEQGNYSINYIEMVPLLVQSIKELSSEVTALKQQLGTQESVKKGKKQVSSIEDADMEVVSMSQNRPNPFKDKSVIVLNVPSDTKEAVINIYDMSGKQVQTIPVSERGRTNITVYASHLQPGMFIYSLLVDGKVQATRKMMVTE